MGSWGERERRYGRRACMRQVTTDKAAGEKREKILQFWREALSERTNNGESQASHGISRVFIRKLSNNCLETPCRQ